MKKAALSLLKSSDFTRRVFVRDQRGHHQQPRDADRAEMEGPHESREHCDHEQVKETRQHQRIRNAQVTWDGVQSRLAIVLVVLATVENVKASRPKSDRCGEQQDPRIERATDGDPCTCRRHA